MCRYILVFISCSTVHSTQLTKQQTHSFSECWKSLSTEFFAAFRLLRRWTASLGLQPNTSTPDQLCDVASAYLAFAPLHHSVSVGDSLCASLCCIFHQRMLRDPGPRAVYFFLHFAHKPKSSVVLKSAATKFVPKSRPRSLKPRQLIVLRPLTTEWFSRRLRRLCLYGSF